MAEQSAPNHAAMATATFSDSTTQDLTSQVMWTSSDPAVATINLNGVATSAGVGSTMVKATSTINGVTESDVGIASDSMRC